MTKIKKFLIRHNCIENVKVGEEVMILSNFFGVEAGTKGKVIKVVKESKMIKIKWKGLTKRDWLTENEFARYLVFSVL